MDTMISATAENKKTKMMGSLSFMLVVLMITGCNAGNSVPGKLPERGVCAHRGAMETHPENTLSAFREAVRLGAHMIEFDLRMTKDGHLVILHDETVDRTTNGVGEVNELTMYEIRKLDAGSWKSERFKDERIPTLKEALAVMPDNIWLNVHIKGGKAMGEKVARVITEEHRGHQAFLACGSEAARGAKEINRDIRICNMDRLDTRDAYVKETIRLESQFIQLHRSRTSNRLDSLTAALKQHHIRINYCCTDSSAEGVNLFENGVDFVLTDQLSGMLKAASTVGIEPLNAVQAP
jgi:glycerophosphoryl diester phosphodiesterase